MAAATNTSATPEPMQEPEPMLEDFEMINVEVEAPAEAVQITCSGARREVGSGAEAALEVLVTLSMAAAPEDERLPVELVICADRSGSMSGEKIKKVKQALEFLVGNGLKVGDTLGLVSFDHEVEVPLRLTRMSGATRSSAKAAVQRLHHRGRTNLSGGLLRGLDLLNQSDTPAGQATRAVLLFTDGQANEGITDTTRLIEAVRGQLDSARPTTIFTFGFGADHNEDMLKALSDLTPGGQYYFIDKEDDIPAAFSDCLGGLCSVVGQNGELQLAADLGAQILRVRGGAAKAEVDGPAAAAAAVAGVRRLELGDLYAEEEKDLVVSLKLPALLEPVPAPSAVLNATLRYFSVVAKKYVEASATLEVARPAEAAADQPTNHRLEEQVLRIESAEAMAQAASLADAGDIAAGRLHLKRAMERASTSPSAESPLVAGLVEDLERCTQGYVDEPVYRSMGSKFSKMSARAHMTQSSNHTSAQSYLTPLKAKMRTLFEAGEHGDPTTP